MSSERSGHQSDAKLAAPVLTRINETQFPINVLEPIPGVYPIILYFVDNNCKTTSYHDVSLTLYGLQPGALEQGLVGKVEPSGTLPGSSETPFPPLHVL